MIMQISLTFTGSHHHSHHHTHHLHIEVRHRHDRLALHDASCETTPSFSNRKNHLPGRHISSLYQQIHGGKKIKNKRILSVLVHVASPIAHLCDASEARIRTFQVAERILRFI